ncbi:sugar ABC transporter substrate-binding protein [Agrococcus jejuensis]|uniref:Carbohydrate ABC transporter substrate-binding protein, CUT1 family n=1 Tax=Agrococcus jejuensis TaxID=399736 RepID=A0A1G8DUX7_9MICO|nr:extracellular solute-binding protein [Agrococcus jejuensis]SDH61250.1 carbohydrate ABC transporter substrate-binding protein, CUT1 family [Agrococcus jejuensis]
MTHRRRQGRALQIAAITGIGAIALAGCSGGGSGGGGDEPLQVLIGTSGDAETQAVQAAVDAWTEESGIAVEVVVASDLGQELAQGFAGDIPPDLFYMSWDQFQTYAADDYLEPYAAGLDNAGDFYPALADTFSYDGELICDPKDFSTLGLVINTDLWAAAGLTDADIPTDWDSLATVAQTLTTDDTVGLSMGAEYARVGVFMEQAGGGLMTDDEVTADSPENVEALTYLQGLLTAGSLAWPADLGAGWGGEAFGNQQAAMVIEGPWIAGALENDFPDVSYQIAELPAGPGGQGTYTFSNCWGIPEGADTAEDAASLVEFLTSDDQQLAFSDAFGVIPSTESAAATYAETYPENAAFVAGADYAVSPIAFPGASEVVGEFNTVVPTLATADPQAILTTLQGQLEDAWSEVE